MNRITEQMALSLQDEVEKVAVSWSGITGAARKAGGYLVPQATSVGAGAALSGVGGAGIGALAGGAAEYHRARQEGESGRGLASRALRGGLGGARKGALIGAGVGGAAGLAGGGHARELVAGLRQRDGMLGSVSRFGERQVHGLTGALPPGMSYEEGMKALRMGVAPRQAALKGATEAADKFRGLSEAALDAPGARDLARKAYATESAAAKALQGASTLQDLKATSIPGYLKALATKPGATLGAGLKEGWYGGGTGIGGAANKALTFGLPAVGVAEALTSGDDATRGQRLAQAAGGLTYGITGGIPLSGHLALTSLGMSGLTSAGKQVDRLRTARALQTRAAADNEADPATHGLQVERGSGVEGLV